MQKISDGFIHLIVKWIILSKMLDVRKDASGMVGEKYDKLKVILNSTQYKFKLKVELILPKTISSLLQFDI